MKEDPKTIFIEKYKIGKAIPQTDEEVRWVEEWLNLDENKEFVAQCDENLKEMEARSVLCWYELASYLRGQVRDGNTEFRMSAIGERKLLIRPFGKDKTPLEINI